MQDRSLQPHDFSCNARRVHTFGSSAPFRSRRRACPVCPNQRTFSQAVETTESCQQRSLASNLFDHLVGAGDQRLDT